MVDLVVTATSVVPGGGAKTVDGFAGATITAGQVVYYDSSAGTYKLADNNSGTAAVRSPAGIALNGAATGQPVEVLTSGKVTIGATVTAGVAYYLSDTPGGICPVADIASGEYPVFLGFATTAAIIDVNIVQAGVALA
jgi:hypothetical protein